jgi:hypothetical protein
MSEAPTEDSQVHLQVPVIERLLSGATEAHALWITRDVAARTLALWRPGCRIFAHPPGLLLVFEAPRRLHADTAPGAPWQRRDDRLTSAALSPKRWAVLRPPAGQWLWFDAGRLHCAEPGPEVRPAELLDLGPWTACVPETLGAPPKPIVVVQQADARGAFDGAVAPPSAESVALAEALEHLEAGRPPPDAGPPGLGARALALAAGGTLSLLQRLRMLGKRRQGAQAAGTANAGTANAGAANSDAGAPAKPRRQGGLLDRLDRWLARAAAAAGLDAAIGAAHARLMNQLLDRFDQGDLAEALRHAIPIGGGSDGGAARLAGLRAPAAREDLRITAASGPTSSTIRVQADLQEALRQRYRQAIVQLLAEGRCTEAAFVYAQLLNEPEAAVELLEKNGEFARAAEVAEARELPPERAICLWLAAGQIPRAVDLARRHLAFAAAVARLAPRDPEAAGHLRALWAATLAAGGDYAQAVRVLAPLGFGPTVSAWLDQVIAEGATAAPDLIALKLREDPEAFESLRPYIADVFEAEGLAGERLREVFADALMGPANAQAGFNPAEAVVGRHLLRRLLADRGRRDNPIRVTRSRNLADRSGGGTRALLPDLGPWSEHTAGGATVTETVFANDRGTLPVFDAVVLPDGGALVALGEAGVRLLTRDGRTKVHWNQPAEHLVMADGGHVALGLTQSGRSEWRVARFDLVTRSGQHLLDLPLDGFDRRFDAGGWWVHHDGRLHLLDVLHAGGRSLWSVALHGAILNLTANTEWLSVLTREPDAPTCEQWRFERKSLQLRQRTPVDPYTHSPTLHGVPLGLGRLALDTGNRWSGWHDDDGNLRRMGLDPTPGDLPPGRLQQLEIEANLDAPLVASAAGIAVVVVASKSMRPALVVQLVGATRAHLRWQADALVVCDDRGRVIAWDRNYDARWATLSNLRLS